MKHFILSALALLWAASSTDAQIVDRIVTRNGEVYEGYISYQIPGKTVSIISSRTVRFASPHEVNMLKVQDVMVADLSEDQADYLPYLKDGDSVEIVTIIAPGRSKSKQEYKNCIVLEDGDEIRFVSFAPVLETIAWKDIRLYGKVHSGDDLGSAGLCDVLMLPNAERIEGRFLEKDLVKQQIRFLTKDGKIRNYRGGEIQSMRTETTSPESSIWEKVPYCDEVVIKSDNVSAQPETLSGFIVAKQLGKQITLQLYNTNEIRLIPNSDIVSYGKHPNPLYKKPVVQEPAEEVTPDLYINGEVRKVYEFVTTEKSRCMSVDVSVDSIASAAKVGEKVVIKMKLSTRTSKIKLAKCTEEEVQTMTVRSRSRIQSNKTVQIRPYFSSETVLSAPDFNFQLNDGDYVTVDIVPGESGTYVLFVEGQNKCALFKVEGK